MTNVQIISQIGNINRILNSKEKKLHRKKSYYSKDLSGSDMADVLKDAFNEQPILSIKLLI